MLPPALRGTRRGELAAATKKGSWWTRRGRKVVTAVVALELVSVVLFVAALVVGENSHASFFALYLPRLPLLLAVIAGAVLIAIARRRVLLAIHIGLALAILFPVMGMRVTFPSAKTSAEEGIRLATYNVHFGKDGRPQLIEELAAMPVDILLLQAAYDSLGARLRERFPDRHVRQEGELVIVTRYPIRDIEVPLLLEAELRPMFVGYVLDTPAGPLRIFNIHPYSPRNALFDSDGSWDQDVARREAQVEAVAAASRRPGPRYLIVGDTNLPHLSTIFRTHFGDLTDAFDEAGRGFGYTFPAKRPWMRIDRALASPGVRFTSVRVGPKGASDHRPLFFEIAVRK